MLHIHICIPVLHIHIHKIEIRSPMSDAYGTTFSTVSNNPMARVSRRKEGRKTVTGVKEPRGKEGIEKGNDE